MTSFKLYMLGVMKDERGGALAGALKCILLALSWIYALAVSVVDKAYASGFRRTYKSPVPVVSVGNLTLGGTGKTPFTVLLADHFREEGRRPAVLIRGYGDDEHRLLRDELPDTPVFTGKNRVRSAMEASREDRNILILDDGYQHRKIRRDANILLVDGEEMFGNGFLFPRGVLREPAGSAGRADLIVVTKSDRMEEADKEKVTGILEKFAPGKPVSFARHLPRFLTDVTGEVSSLETLKGQDICAVCGIADPAYFGFTLEEAGARVAGRVVFEDHHRYGRKDIDHIAAVCGGMKIVITKKDHVKMQGLDLSGIEDKLFILHIAMDLTEGKEKFIAGLDSLVSGTGS